MDQATTSTTYLKDVNVMLASLQSYPPQHIMMWWSTIIMFNSSQICVTTILATEIIALLMAIAIVIAA